jgi:hypothetical protein
MLPSISAIRTGTPGCSGHALPDFCFAHFRRFGKGAKEEECDAKPGIHRKGKKTSTGAERLLDLGKTVGHGVDLLSTKGSILFI